MNNKGQSLTLFVVIVPLILLILLMVYEVGRMTLLRHTLDNINILAMNYGVTKLDDDNVTDDVRELILKNDSDIENVTVLVKDNKLYISLESSISNNSLFKNVFKVNSSYVGYMEEEKKIIKKDK